MKQVIILLLLISNLVHAKCAAPQCHDSTCAILQKVYDPKVVNGFHIQPEEHKKITQCGGAPTYGEITDEAARMLFNELKPTEQDILGDLGSGCGRFCVYALYATPIKKAVGIELSATRAKHAQIVKDSLIKSKKMPQGKTLILQEKNFMEADLSPLTIVYMASTCYSDELMKQITEKLAKTKQKKLTVVTLKRLTDHPRFKLVKTLVLPMTWSKTTPAYAYELVH